MIVERKRHIAKTISYRLISTLSGFGFIYIATGSVALGTTFSIFELAYKPFIYYLHERAWYKFAKFGLKK
jgi:uncharacterized membrane protein